MVVEPHTFVVLVLEATGDVPEVAFAVECLLGEVPAGVKGLAT